MCCAPRDAARVHLCNVASPVYLPLLFSWCLLIGVKSSLASEVTLRVAFIGGYNLSAEGALI